jgi:hypothetical protein
MRRRLTVALAATVLLAGCAPDSDQPDPGGSPAPPSAAQTHPDVVDVSVERAGDSYAFTVTISSPYDTPQRYADGWRVLGPDQTVYGEHTLTHDHAAEQPFTRTQTGVRIPAGVAEVTVEGRDSRYGYGGTTLTVALPPAG